MSCIQTIESLKYFLLLWIVHWIKVAKCLAGGAGETFPGSFHLSPCGVVACGSVKSSRSNFSFFMDRMEDCVTWGVSKGDPKFWLRVGLGNVG